MGRLIWNRLNYCKDPETGKRRSRANARDAVVKVEAPDLAIVSIELCDALKARQAGLDVRTAAKKPSGSPPHTTIPFWNIAEAYRRKVRELQAALEADDAAPARELIRGLVEAVVLVPENGRLRGELAAILRLSGCAEEKAPALGPGLLGWLVAGARNLRELTLNCPI